ncbi:MAG TPA: hypothetical protein VM055_07140 [Novosphingobium sp.]|nr:hypothetical protein [Novosphingobium sp.]
MLSLPGPGFAQNIESETDRRVQDRITAQKSQTDLRDKRCVLGNASADEIIVCRKRDDEADRYPGREDLDSAKSTNDGLPRAPDLSPRYPKGQVSIKGCFIPPCPGPPIYYFDVKEIPEAPANSDADLIAKGEKAEP